MTTNKCFVGLSRQIDELGRIVIPKEIRTANNITQGDRLSISVGTDGIVLRPLKDTCAICGSEDELLVVDGITICRSCGEKIKEVMA